MTANAWFAFVLFGLVAYVALDGYDLGIGTLAMAHRRYEERFSLLEIVARSGTATSHGCSWSPSVCGADSLPCSADSFRPSISLPS